MKQALQLRLGQQLTMTPQMQQAIRLLQMSALELQAELREALDSNLMLEVPEDDTQTDWVPSSSPAVAYPDAHELQMPEVLTLQDHLHWQLGLTPFTEKDAYIATALIDAIDDDGYLGVPLEEIVASQPGHTELTEVEAVLHRLQRFDPVGVAARTPVECLTVQLGQLAPGTPGLELALRIVHDHLETLANSGPLALADALGAGQDEYDQALALVHALHPHPGAGFSATPTEYVVPDVIVVRHGTCWRAELNPEVQPRLRINPAYADLAGDKACSESDNACIRDHLQQARWLIKSLQQRAQTLQRVSSFLVEHQGGFLDHGDAALRPLSLREVAEALGMHESTISRVTTNKWMHTPRGVVEFRRFFSGQLGTTDGSGASATAVRAVIRTLLAGEDPSEPLSDNIISTRLAAMGYRVARRTVAKYRDNMSIPPAHERRRAG